MEFQAHVAAVVGSYGPQNPVEVELLERVAVAAWSLGRVSRAEAAQVCQRIRHEAIERDQREREEAIALGQRLLWNARGPWQLYPHAPHTGLEREKRGSWSEDPADPNHPALLVCRLERTVAGCRWLLARWAELLARLEPGEVWAGPDQFKAVRLLGKQPLDAVDDPEVTQIFLASARLFPEGDDAKAFAPVKNELRSSRMLRDGKDDQSIYSRELKKRPVSQLRPADADAAREVLRALVDRQVARLKLILAQNQEIAEADAAEAPARLAFDPSAEGDKRRRYALSAARLINQTLNTFVKIRKDLDSAGSAESSFARGPLSFEDWSVVRDPLSAEESSVVRSPVSLDDAGQAFQVADPPGTTDVRLEGLAYEWETPDSLSSTDGVPSWVEASCGRRIPADLAEGDDFETPDCVAESRARDCFSVGMEASPTNLQTEPNREPCGGEDESSGGGWPRQAGEGAGSGPDQVLQTEPNTGPPAGPDLAANAPTPGDGAVPPARMPRRTALNGLERFREGESAAGGCEPGCAAARTEPRPPRITKTRFEDEVADVERRAWEQVLSEIRAGRGPRGFEALAEEESTGRRKKKRAKTDARR